MNLCEEILDEALDLIVDVQLDSPGNPIFIKSGISKKELRDYYEPHLKKKCSEGILDLVFFSKGVASGYYFTSDLRKVI